MAEQTPQSQGLEPPSRQSVFGFLRTWGESSAPPTFTATLIAAQHLQPFQFLPIVFAPLMLFSTYMNLNGYKIDAAGANAAWSGLYVVLAQRRKRPFVQKWGARGLVRGGTMGLCAVNVAAGGFVYATGRRSAELDNV
ncbi:hypothetical protein MMC10_001097 [Thelotrema lepadinum]|nr:hypothetical protein [Thelotrema lepadinum]